MTQDERKIIEAIGLGGKSRLKIAYLSKIPIKEVNRITARLHRKKVLSMKAEDTYWLSQQYKKQMEALNTVA